ncbi:MAG: DUF2269 family protein [Acidibacillus sp.]|uniref:Uncharacterized protein n=1 Tax=Sulfoacidibacillus ferrooxidans TaxID=2005001 RepID=A0A9X1VC18_9BACL|nr:DUF2269 family protein [Sulfoacidibacillus ferrooxidans]MCI0183247.1 hypothetical protein [Sulfoacidibacillus ferrooxidans]MCY0893779.1 DUF2269 family protein [Acidibacillus sp.]
MLFYSILSVHLLAVLAKISVFFTIPRLKDVESVQSFFRRYQVTDRIANYTMWITGALLLVVTSWKLLLQMWLLVSMLLYILVFLLIRGIVFRRLRIIADSQKLYARDELKLLRVESYCVMGAALGLLGGIGYLMVHKPWA